MNASPTPTDAVPGDVGLPSSEAIEAEIRPMSYEGADLTECVERVRALFAPAFEAKEREIAEWQREAVRAQSKLRWNIDDEGRLVRLCDGEHDKGEPCEFTTYVPEQDLRAAEAKLAQAVEELSGLRQAILDAAVICDDDEKAGDRLDKLARAIRARVCHGLKAGRLAGLREAAEVIVAQIQAPYTGARSDDFMNGWAQGANATAERNRSAILALAERGEG